MIENHGHRVFQYGERERAEKIIVTSSTAPIVWPCSRNARSSPTSAPDCPGTMNSRYSVIVASSRDGSITCDSAISIRIKSGISDSRRVVSDGAGQQHALILAKGLEHAKRESTRVFQDVVSTRSPNLRLRLGAELSEVTGPLISPHAMGSGPGSPDPVTLFVPCASPPHRRGSGIACRLRCSVASEPPRAESAPRNICCRTAAADQRRAGARPCLAIAGE